MTLMRSLKTTLAATICWGALVCAGRAQTLVEDPSGFRTRIPAGYTVSQDSTGLVASNAGGTVALVVKAHNYGSFEAFARQANLQRDGFTLVGEPRTLEKGAVHFRASKARPQGGYVIADTFVTFAPRGGGVLVVALSDQDTAEEAYGAAYDVVARLELTEPTATAASSAWEAALRGKHLVYLYTGNDYSERFDLYLFADGSFAQGGDMSSASASGTGWMEGRSEGTWRVTPAGQLVLSFQDGRTRAYALSRRQAANEVGLDGKRYFVTAP
jgi:hypothetical protein